MLGSILAAVGLALSTAASVHAGIVTGVLLLAAAATLRPNLRPWLPERSCQVAGSTMKRRRPIRGAFEWGALLGVGVSTFMVTPALYGVLVLAVGQQRAISSVSICVTYGLARVLTIVVFSVRFARGTERRESIPALEIPLRLPASLIMVLAAVGAFLV